jgi:hypothetical protein
MPNDWSGITVFPRVLIWVLGFILVPKPFRIAIADEPASPSRRARVIGSKDRLVTANWGNAVEIKTEMAPTVMLIFESSHRDGLAGWELDKTVELGHRSDRQIGPLDTRLGPCRRAKLISSTSSSSLWGSDESALDEHIGLHSSRSGGAW